MSLSGVGALLLRLEDVIGSPIVCVSNIRSGRDSNTEIDTEVSMVSAADEDDPAASVVFFLGRVAAIFCATASGAVD